MQLRALEPGAVQLLIADRAYEHTVALDLVAADQTRLKPKAVPLRYGCGLEVMAFGKRSLKMARNRGLQKLLYFQRSWWRETPAPCHRQESMPTTTSATN